MLRNWLARTVLVYTLHVPVEKFNDDRLGRTLAAIGPHARDIWQDILGVALLRFDIDVRLLFYDLTAFVVHGEYKKSALAKFGFAHNTRWVSERSNRCGCGRRRQSAAGLRTLVWRHSGYRYRAD